jgi:hypothetical protein
MSRSSGSGKALSVPDYIVNAVDERLKEHVRQNWPGCARVTVRKRGAFVYVDAQGKDDPEPAPLCRLRYLGSADSWEFAYFTWSREAYEPSFLDSGSPFGTPEECFDASAAGMFS